jgi:sorting nexin-4
MMDTIGDSLLNAFSRIRKADPRFIEMKEHTERMEENLDLLQKTLLRSNKRTEDLCKDYHEFVTTVKGLLDLDSGYKGLLEPVSDGLDQFTTSLEKMVRR